MSCKHIGDVDDYSIIGGYMLRWCSTCGALQNYDGWRLPAVQPEPDTVPLEACNAKDIRQGEEYSCIFTANHAPHPHVFGYESGYLAPLPPPPKPESFEPPIRQDANGTWLWWDRKSSEWKPETTDAHRAHRLARERDALAVQLVNSTVARRAAEALASRKK